MTDHPAELDVVALTRAVDGKPPGTEGTILEIRDGVALLEIDVADGSGRDFADAFLDAPLDALRVTWSYRA